MGWNEMRMRSVNSFALGLVWSYGHLQRQLATRRMANEGATVAAHVKILYCLVVVLIIGEIGSYYYSLYLYTSVQEECSRLRCGLPMPPLGPVPTPEHQQLVRRRRAKLDDQEDAEFFPHDQPGAVHGVMSEDKKFVWVNSYSRINVKALDKFCKDVKDLCPVGPAGPVGPKGSIGPPGPQGEQGIKGELGDRGPKGELGDLGYPGSYGDPGPPGPIGPRGEKGKAGLDGRHGLAGEPGLDGVPGRDGIDGIPGLNGTNGTPGKPGHNGHNGTNGTVGPKGKPGIPGTPGLPGLKGEPGLPGPKGKKGLDGRPGTPGVHGVSVWTVNGTGDKLIPPSIVDKNLTVISVNEGSNLRLVCKATGIPTPEITWRREDHNQAVLKGLWQNSAVIGTILNITQVTRQHMGRYSCIAANGINPKDMKYIDVEVKFGPYILIRHPYVETRKRNFVHLECRIEAYPEPLNDWMDENGHLIETNSVYTVTKEHANYSKYEYSLKMQINISNMVEFAAGNVKEFHCVSRNAINTTTGVIHVGENVTVVPKTDRPVSYGTTPPPSVDYSDICGEQEACPVCPDPLGPVRCHGLANDIQLIKPKSNTTKEPEIVLPPRGHHCLVDKVGKPVFRKYTNSNYGAWMRDPRATEKYRDKYWLTLSTQTSKLYEYANKDTFLNGQWIENPHELPNHFQGNGHVVYKDRFYYHHNGTSHIIRYDLSSETIERLDIRDTTPNAALDKGRRLYMANHTYVDLATDENGLWAVYGLNDSNYTVVMKINPDKMKAEKTWLLSLQHAEIGDTFIVCGVLYVLDTTLENKAKIVVGFDLYENRVLSLDTGIMFSNPFSLNVMVAYNHHDKAILSWDKGHQLTIPILLTSRELSKSKVTADQSDRGS